MRALYHHRTQGRDAEAVHIHGLCSGLEQLGYEVEIVGPPGVRTDPDSAASPLAGKPPNLLGVLARRAPQALFECLEIAYNAVALPRLLLRCRARPPDLIYERYALFNAAGVLAGRLCGVPVILEVNDTADMDRTRQGRRLLMRPVARWLERRVFRMATGIVTVSGYLRDEVTALGVPPERVRVTPNAVDAAKFDPDRVDGSEVRRRWGLHGATVIGFAGSFAKWHGVDLLVRAFARISPDFPELRLLLIGDGALRPRAEEEAAALGVRDRVVFTGKVPHAAIPACLAAIDVGVMPASNRFGSPMKVYEYMAMGRPPVAPRYGPLEEAVRDGVDGLLFDPEDPAGLESCLRRLAAEPDLRVRLGAAARTKVRATRQWVHNAAAALELARGRGRPEVESGSAAA